MTGMLQSLMSCWRDSGISRIVRPPTPLSLQDQAWQSENLDQMINEVLLEEIAKLRATFSHHLREYEVTLSQLSENGQSSWVRQDVEILRQQVHLMERQKKRRNLEVGKLKKAMKEVRNALFTESPPAAQGHLAAQQLLDEVRTERERRLAEKHYLEEQVKKLQDEIQEQNNSAPAVDHEKEKLKASVKQLKMSIESKDRYACWVCNRAHERHEESADGSDSGEDSDRHEDECVMMRRRLDELEQELRQFSADGEGPTSDGAEAASSSRRPLARLSAEPPSVTESPMGPSSTLRSSRDRVPTPWASQAGGLSESEASVQFSDSVTTVTSPEVPETVPEVGNRSVRDRIATPYVAPGSGEDRRVILAPVLSSIEEFEADSNREQLRSSRDRMPTPHVSSQLVEETFANSAKTVRIFPAADVEAIPVSGEGRSTRERIATPFMKEEYEDARAVHFEATPERPPARRAPTFGAVQEIQSEISADKQLRPSRERMPTPHVKLDALEEDGAKHVRIVPDADVEALPVAGERRPSRDRIPTPFIKGDELAKSAVQFDDGTEASKQRCSVAFGDSEEFESDIKPDGDQQMRSSRDRIPTPHVKMELIEDDDVKHVRMAPTSAEDEDVSDDRKASTDLKAWLDTPASSRGRSTAPSFGGSEEFEVEAEREPFKASRDRVPTPHVSCQAIEEAFGGSKSVHIVPAADVQVIPAVGETRSSRDRIATPFFKDEAAEEGRAVHFDTVPSEVRPITGRHVVGTRSVRDRAPTPYTSGEIMEEPHPHFASLSRVEEIEVDGELRTTRDRVPTPRVSSETMEEFEADSGRTQFRSSRDRMPTPHVSSQVIEETFANSAKTVRIFPAADVEAIQSTGEGRSVRQRIATPFIQEEVEEARTVHFEAARPSKPSTRAPTFGAVEELSIKPVLSSTMLRPSRERIPTPFVKDVVEEPDKHVRIAPTADVEALPVSGERRPSRHRIPTPFVQEPLEDLPKHVSIDDDVDVEAVPVSGERRPSRDRIATPFIKEQLEEPPKHVCISGNVDVEAVPVSGERRPSRDRIATPFIKGDELAKSAVQFDDGSTQEFETETKMGENQQLRSSRDRIPTPHLKIELMEEQFDDVKRVHMAPNSAEGEDSFDETKASSRGRSPAPTFGGAQEFEVEAVKDHLRACRDRVPTPHVSSDLIEETFAGFAKSVHIFPAADVQVIPGVGDPRSSRERIATPYFKEDDAVEESRAVHFDPVHAEVPPVGGRHVQTVGTRSVHDRLPTPYASADCMEEPKIHFASSSRVEEVELESGKEHLRASRDRVPTPHVSSELLEETFAGSKSVRILPSADVEAIPVIGEGRTARDRIATPFVKEDESMRENRTVHFNQFGQEMVEAPAALGPYTNGDVDAPPDVRSVSFRPASLVEFDNVSPVSDEAVVVRNVLPLKSVRDRQQTSWAPQVQGEDRCVRFQEAKGQSASSASRTTSESPAGQHAETASASNGRSKEARSRGGSEPDDPPSDAETVSSASSRNPRSRMSTPFMSAAEWGYDVSVPSAQVGAESVSSGSSRRRRSKPSSLEPTPATATDRNLVKQVSIESSIEREISERVKLNAQRQAREERLVRVGSTDANVPLALERCCSADGGNPEADLANHIVGGAVKDTELLRNTLRNLVFFETFDDDALHGLIEAMEVYEFQHGEKVVRQGDTDGTHFFVVAQGEFCVLKDNIAHCYIGPGTSFGESVLLLFGERTATVGAQGCARAYGMEGMQVRELLSKQYEQRRLSIVEATDEVMKSNICEVLAGLNGYQLQSLYDQVEMRSFEKGDVILKEGDSPNEVLILYSGMVHSWSRGQDMEVVPRFHLMGDRALVFEDELPFEQPTTLKAETAVEVLVLKRSLLDNIFGDQLQQVLVKHRVLYVLAKHQDFSRLHQEHREAVASACQIRCLPKGSEQDWEDVRVIVALNGEVELMLNEIGTQRLMGASPTMFSIPYIDQSAVKIKALADSKLAVWQREDLESILAFDDFDGAVEQDSKVRSLQSVFIFATLSKQQLKRLADALEIETVEKGIRVFSQGDQGTHFYIIRKGAVSVEIDGREKRRLGDPDYFGERALLGSEIRSASIAALEDTELWKMGKETFQEMMQGPCLDYLKDRISLQDTNLTFQDLEFVRVIGRGGFGVVKMVRAKKTGVRYALKCVRKRDVVEKNVQDALVSELSILKEVDHPFIIKFVRSFRNKTHVYFLMELVSGGELLDALDSLGLLKYNQALFYTGCITLALEFLHARRIAYLDLKSENCLIDQQGYLKIIDFGIARRITNTRYGPLKGTPMFMAPEMILGKGHTTVADLWSLGICLYEFVIGNFPFASNCTNHGQIFHEILRAELRFPPWFDKQPMAEDIMSLIRGLLTRDPKKRLGAGHEGYTKLKGHAFFKHLCWEKLLGRELEPPFVPTNETYAEDKEKPTDLPMPLDLPTVEEEEARCAAQEEPWEDPAPGWDADF
ncbi:unnamed protein product [Effrenium voratum]|uniref:cGMP-dependent protein kinase n=1 Tax=Effrenium voratum TaxID=2562239 RepID=A0AA36JSE9_9DINO|nr:unnamed protein product [Effrenium voratum]